MKKLFIRTIIVLIAFFATIEGIHMYELFTDPSYYEYAVVQSYPGIKEHHWYHSTIVYKLFFASSDDCCIAV